MTSIARDQTPSSPMVQMTLSSENTVDLMGRFLPAGNYYFTAKHFYKDMVCGSLTSKGEAFGEFCFTNKELVKMMAVAQARLGRRANITETGMPTYSSPVIRRKRPRPVTPKVCSICYDNITATCEKRVLPCKHEFHAGCIGRWLRTGTNTCPLCRASVTRLPTIHRRRARAASVLPTPPTGRRYPMSGRPVYNRYSMYQRQRG